MGKPTIGEINQCLIALMSNVHISIWVNNKVNEPGSGGAMEIWTTLAVEYAENICQKLDLKFK